MIWNVHLICISYGILTRFKTGIHLLYFHWWISVWIFIQVLMWYQIIIHKHKVMKYIYISVSMPTLKLWKWHTFYKRMCVLGNWFSTHRVDTKAVINRNMLVNLNCKVILHCNPSPLFCFWGRCFVFCLLRGGGTKLA